MCLRLALNVANSLLPLVGEKIPSTWRWTAPVEQWASCLGVGRPYLPVLGANTSPYALPDIGDPLWDLS